MYKYRITKYSNKKSSESCFSGTGVTHFRLVAAPYRPCRKLARFKFPRASGSFVWFGFGLFGFFTEEVNIGSDSRETDNAHACSLKCKSTFTHKVQVSASRRATGAVLPIWLTLFRMCFSISVILHSGAFESHRTVLFFLVLASPQREDTSLPLFSPLPADSLRLDRRHIPPFALSETHYLSPVVEMPAGIS